MKSKTLQKTKPAIKNQRRPKSKTRPVHKRIALHPLVVFLFLCIGVLLVLSTWKSSAASYVVTAEVPAPVLTKPAVILSPINDSVVTDEPIIIKGSCPNNSYVKLERNNVFSGVAICLNNKFTINTDLFIGNNQLNVQDFNTTNSPGPISTPITITYSPPTATPTTPTTSPSSTSPKNTNTKNKANTQPTQSVTSAIPKALIINTAYLYRVFNTGQTFSWKINLIGGVPPYSLSVSWGDGQKSAIILSSYQTTPNSVIDIKHTYQQPGDYLIKVSSFDHAGDNALIQLVAVIKGTGNAIGPSGNATSNDEGSILPSIGYWAWLVWPAYLILSLMIISFWLGEREQYQMLRLKHRKPRLKT